MANWDQDMYSKGGFWYDKGVGGGEGDAGAGRRSGGGGRRDRAQFARAPVPLNGEKIPKVRQAESEAGAVAERQWQVSELCIFGERRVSGCRTCETARAGEGQGEGTGEMAPTTQIGGTNKMARLRMISS